MEMKWIKIGLIWILEVIVLSKEHVNIKLRISLGVHMKKLGHLEVDRRVSTNKI